jgi:hypothetical protein
MEVDVDARWCLQKAWQYASPRWVRQPLPQMPRPTHSLTTVSDNGFAYLSRLWEEVGNPAQKTTRLRSRSKETRRQTSNTGRIRHPLHSAYPEGPTATWISNEGNTRSTTESRVGPGLGAGNAWRGAPPRKWPWNYAGHCPRHSAQ